MSPKNSQPMPGREAYVSALDDLRFSDDSKDRMVANLVASADGEQSKMADPIPTRRKGNLPLAAVMAAVALTVALSGVAFATGAFVSVQLFVSHLFGTEAKVEIVDKIGRPVGVAQSVGGVTVSADAVIGDESNVAVVFSIAKDDGTRFEGIEALEDGILPLGFSDDFRVSLPIFGGYAATGSAYFYDADPNDNAIQLVETRSYQSDDGSNISLVGRMLTVNLADLTYYGEGGTTVIAPGTWSLSFPLNYEDTTRTLEAGQVTEVNGVPTTIDRLSISPIALHVAYTVDQKVEWTSGESGQLSEHDSKVSDSLLGIEASVTMDDGTTLDVPIGSGGGITPDGDVTRCETSIFFDRILDLDEVASITVGGTTIEL